MKREKTLKNQASNRKKDGSSDQENHVNSDRESPANQENSNPEMTSQGNSDQETVNPGSLVREKTGPEGNSSQGNSARMETGKENRLTENVVREETGSSSRKGSLNRESGKRESKLLKDSLRCQIVTSNKGGVRYSAFAKLSAAVQVKSTPMGRIEVKGFRKEND